jgi:hypothetical protein
MSVSVECKRACESVQDQTTLSISQQNVLAIEVGLGVLHFAKFNK